RIRALLRREGSTLLPVLEWENLQLDPGACEVTCNSQPIYLRPKEYDLLELFLRNPHRVFSRGAILDHLWSFEEAPGEETVTAHIKGLRQHLKAAGVAHNPIETVYGMGYRLREPEELEKREAGEVEKQGEQGRGELNNPFTHPKSKIQNLKSKTAVSPELEQRAVAVAAGIWEQTKAKFRQRMAVIEQATKMLLENTLEDELQQAAEQAAHKLAGSLGMFNFDKGSRLARETERLFHSGSPLNPDQKVQLSELAAALSQEIQQTVKAEIPNLLQAQSTNRALRTAPLLLIVTPDKGLAEALLRESNHWRIEARLAPDLTAAREQVSSDRPDVVLLDSFGEEKSEVESQKSEVRSQKSRQPKAQGISSRQTALKTQTFPPPLHETAIAPTSYPTHPTPHTLSSPPISPPANPLIPPSALKFLAELSAYTPPVPVLVMRDHDSLIDRVKVARLGGRGFLQRSLPSAQVMEVVNQTLQRSRPMATRVMAVDDDSQVLLALRVLLEPWGVQLVTLDDPRTFWQTLEATAPDLLILDIEMPHMQGIELCQVVRNDPRWGSLPILFLTVHTDSETMRQVFEVGADDYVSKPIVGPELLTRILNRLERSRLLQAMAETDALTGLTNRRKAIQDLTQLFRLADCHRQPLCFAILDIDGLKQINEQHGHATGDEVLSQFGKLLRNTFPGEDVVARWGGAEFVIAMAGMTRNDGMRRLSEVLQELAQKTFKTPTGATFRITFSAGGVQRPEDGVDLPALYRAANAVLSQAKASGGNCIVCS
ncbi:MAG: diguanylate cyclase, partial [Pseudanabaenales cyanobacterium]|nr:diguanylate cyclase [Pseudanabaenales cyanobacterium]